MSVTTKQVRARVSATKSRGVTQRPRSAKGLPRRRSQDEGITADLEKLRLREGNIPQGKQAEIKLSAPGHNGHGDEHFFKHHSRRRTMAATTSAATAAIAGSITSANTNKSAAESAAGSRSDGRKAPDSKKSASKHLARLNNLELNKQLNATRAELTALKATHKQDLDALLARTMELKKVRAELAQAQDAIKTISEKAVARVEQAAKEATERLRKGRDKNRKLEEELGTNDLLFQEMKREKEEADARLAKASGDREAAVEQVRQESNKRIETLKITHAAAIAELEGTIANLNHSANSEQSLRQEIKDLRVQLEENSELLAAAMLRATQDAKIISELRAENSGLNAKLRELPSPQKSGEPNAYVTQFDARMGALPPLNDSNSSFSMEPKTPERSRGPEADLPAGSLSPIATVYSPSSH